MLIKNENSLKVNYIKLYNLQQKKIEIPFFQRFYSWKEKEIRELKLDLINAVENPDMQLYLFDFIYYEESNIIKLADGQQRLVTINNLILAINNLIEEEHKNIEKVPLFDVSYEIEKNNNKYQNHFKNDKLTQPFKVIYLNFIDFLKEHEEKLENLIHVIKNNIYIYAKECENINDAFNVFQQINTGGKPLTKDEVIKTALDQCSKKYNISIIEFDKNDIKKSIQCYYKIKEKNFENNFDIMTITTFLKENIVNNKESFLEFVECCKKIKNTNENPLKYVAKYIDRNTIIDIINIFVIKNKNIDDEKYKKFILSLCMMSVVLTLNGKSPTHFRCLSNKIINFIKKNTKLETIRQKLEEEIDKEDSAWKISYNDFEEKVNSKSTTDSMKKAFFIMEVILKNVSGTLNVKYINLEHIYPQKPSAEWSEKGWPCSNKDRESLIESIGNLIIISDKLNKKIQNKYITEKESYYKRSLESDKFLQTPMNELDFVSFEKDKENYISKRQDKLVNLIKELPLARAMIIKK